MWQGINRKSAVLPLSAISTIPRVRTYHTKEPSRFVHALSARPHNRVGGRESSTRADGMEIVFFILVIGFTWIFACRGRSLDDPFLLYNNCRSKPSSCYVRTQTRTITSTREVCRSLTWHSSESESALERFEPVAVVQQLPDGRGTLFAPVAARRQKVFKRGIDTYAKHVCRRRRDGSQYFPLFVLFVLFGQAKRTL